MALEVIGNELLEIEFQNVKEDTCPSLSGRSTIIYQVGQTSDKDILIRIVRNSGAGKFNNEWISADTISELIDNADGPFYSSLLIPLYEKKSVNSAGFLMAILKHEGLVKSLKEGGYGRSKKSIKSLFKSRGSKSLS